MIIDINRGFNIGKYAGSFLKYEILEYYGTPCVYIVRTNVDLRFHQLNYYKEDTMINVTVF